MQLFAFPLTPPPPIPGPSRRPLRRSGCCRSSASSASSSTSQVRFVCLRFTSTADFSTDTERYASQIIVFYASMLADAVGPSFVSPSLDLLADFWLDKSGKSCGCLYREHN